MSNDLRDRDSLNVHWRRISTLLRKETGLVARRKRARTWEFHLTLQGKGRLIASVPDILIVDPAQAVQATSNLHSLLSKLKGAIRICDPYFDEISVEHLDACPKNARILLLTRNVKDSGRLRRLHAALCQSHAAEVRICSANVLHDRYVIADAEMLLLGTSLNGFGKKQSFVAKTGSDVRATMLGTFNGHWTSATKWP
jgi:hypothetical protein